MAETAPAKRYRAFISYAHAADVRLAPALQKGLERFARPFMATRAIDVFRDQTNLSTSPGLWSSVQRELADSEFLVLLASPDAAQSKWVRREVDYWVTHAPANKPLIVLTEGEIVFDEERRDFDWQKTTALPSTLAGVYDEEPHYLDLRWAREARDLTLKDARFRDHVADLAATLHRKPKHAMIGEDLHRQRNVRRGIAAVASGFAVFMLLVIWLAVTRAQQSRLNASADLTDRARRQVTMAPERAVLLAVEAVTLSPTDEAITTLRETLVNATPRIELLRLHDAILTGGSDLTATEFISDVSSRDGSISVRSGERFDLIVQRAGAAETVTFSRHRADVNGVTISPDNTLVASVDQDGMGYVWETRSGRIVSTMRPEMEGFGYSRALWSRDGSLLITGGQDSHAQVWDRDTWRQLAVFGDMMGAVDLLAISPDGQLVITGSTTAPYGAPVERGATVWDARTGATLSSRADLGLVVESVGFSSDSRLAFTNYDLISELWDPRTGEVMATWKGTALTIPPALMQSNAIIDAAGSDGSGEGVLGVVRLGFTADGRTLATVDSGGNVLLWRTASWAPLTEPEPGPEREKIGTIAAPGTSVSEVTSPDGTLRIRLGDIEGSGDVMVGSSRTTIGNLRPDSDAVVAGAFTPDGAWVAVADRTRYVRVHRWETFAPLEMLQARAATLVPRSLTAEERAAHVPPVRHWYELWR